jgi:hypothetical protein
MNLAETNQCARYIVDECFKQESGGSNEKPSNQRRDNPQLSIIVQDEPKDLDGGAVNPIEAR